MNLYFHDYLYYSSTFLKIKIQPNLSEQEKKRQRIYDLLNAEISKSIFLCLPNTKKIIFSQKKELFKEK